MALSLGTTLKGKHIRLSEQSIPTKCLNASTFFVLIFFLLKSTLRVLTCSIFSVFVQKVIVFNSRLHAKINKRIRYRMTNLCLRFFFFFLVSFGLLGDPASSSSVDGDRKVEPFKSLSFQKQRNLNYFIELRIIWYSTSIFELQYFYCFVEFQKLPFNLIKTIVPKHKLNKHDYANWWESMKISFRHSSKCVKGFVFVCASLTRGWLFQVQGAKSVCERVRIELTFQFGMECLIW